jgi:iron complex outermembrane receptor protein
MLLQTKSASSSRQAMKTGASMIVLAAAASLVAGAAQAQAPAQAKSAPSAEVEEVVVTGSAIRGVAAVGSNLVSVGQEQLEKVAAANMTQLVNTVPAITNSGSSPQGENAVGYYSPQIHALGASASNTTLVLIDGMRMVGGGTQYAQTDPNIVPTSASQRVEVLADGASSIYGSDAVAGVVNFITRRKFDGLNVNARVGYGDGYRQQDASLIAGKTWDRGSVYVAASHAKGTNVANSDRPLYAMGDFRSLGGTNMQSYACSPATIRTPATGTTRIYLSPTATTTVAQNTDNSPCNTSIYGTAIPGSKRDNLMMKASYDVTDNLTVTGAIIYNKLFGSRPSVPAGLSNVTVFGPGSGKGTQINPFYVAPAGEPTATQETVNWLNLLTPTPTTSAGNETVQLYNFIEYKLPHRWTATLSTGYGSSRSFLNTANDFCQPCALLALNGTAQLNGSATTSVVPNQNVIVTQALTAANALDVWNPAATNRTSAATLRSLYSNATSNTHFNTLFQSKIEFQGPLFSVPAGEVRMATGGEFVTAKQDIRTVAAGVAGSTATSATFTRFNLDRDVYSGYVELAVPLISPEMNIPLVQSLDLSLSGRYDHYSDVGSTTNPKIALNWRPFSWVKLRGNWATAFVAPPLAAIGDPDQGYARTASPVSVAAQTTIPTAFFPSVQNIPGADCTHAGSCIVGLPANQGITRGFGGGLLGIKPSTGESWSIGGDFQFDQWVPGLNASVTLFHNKFRGGTNVPSQPQVLNTAGLQNRVTICPTGCTQAQVDAFTRINNGARINVAIPTTVYFMIDTSQGNVLDIDLTGIDYVFSYRFPTENFGVFRASTSGTLYTQFDQGVAGGPKFSTLGTSGFNTQFPSLKLRTRSNIGWDWHGFSTDIFVSYTPGYRNWSNTSVTPVLTDAVGPISGGDKVKSDLVTDLTVSYGFSSGMLEKSSVYLNVTNLFDKAPPFYNGTTAAGPTLAGATAGYNGLVSNPIGRVVSVGFRAKF